VNALQLHAPPGPALHDFQADDTRATRALLVVNADDWGGFPEGTDAIERCFGAGAISSTTAMMFMADAERARDIAVLSGRPVGLHLNLTQPFESAPRAVRERQLRAIPHFDDLATRRWRLSLRPSVRSLLRDVVSDQLEEFRRLYGHEPTHLDSHHHVHVSPDLLLVLPRDLPVRQTMSPPPGSRSAVRAAKAAFISRRFRTSDELWSFGSLHPALGGSGLEDALERSWMESVEIVCHPSFEQEIDVLLSEDWRNTIGSLPLGNYLDLQDR
jgi:predicted glycoside hydrolase/deacetylase ChbG (UPF0249 family)